MLIVPVLKNQFYGLINSMPSIIAAIQNRLTNIQEMDIFKLEKLAEVFDSGTFIY